MKNKLSKILGVVLTLAMLAGLIVMAVPVSAGNQSWTPIKSVKLYEGTNANVYDMAADGMTMLLYTNDTDQTLYQSTDGGYTWVDSNVDTGDDLAGNTITQLVISQADPEFVLASDNANNIYRSRNGGRTFSTINVPGAVGTLKSIDVSENSNGDEVYLFAYANGANGGGVAMWIDGDWYTTWAGNLGVSTWGTQDAYVAAFAPDFADNPAIVVISSDGTNINLRGLVTISTMTRTWDTDIADVAVKAGAGSAATMAYVAFPSNYGYASSTNNRVFVGLGGDQSGIYTARPRSDRVYELDSGYAVTSIAFTGTASSGTLAVAIAGADDLKVMLSTDANSSSPEFDEMEEWKSPNGTNIKLKFSPNGEMLYAGSEGANSGLFIAEDDFLAFDGIAFINVNALANVSLGSGSLTGVGTPNQYQKVSVAGAGGVTMLFQSTDSGNTWKLIYTNPKDFSLALSPAFATDNTMYAHHASFAPEAFGAPDSGVRDQYDKSTNGGKTWANYSTLGYVKATSFSPIDANNYWIGSTEGIRKTGGSTITIDGNVPAIMIMIPGFAVVYTTSGDVYVSTDMGATFNRLGEEDTFTGVVTATFDVPSKTVYVKSGSGSIVKWAVGTSTAWQTALNISNMPFAAADIDGLSIGAGGVWFIKSDGNAQGLIWRSTDPLNPFNTDAGYGFEPISGTTFNNATIGPGPFMSIVMNPETGVPTYYVVVQNPVAPVTGGYTTNDYKSTWLSFTDVLLAAPKTSAPAEGATVGTSVNIENPNMTSVNFSWSPVNYTGATYQWEVAYDNVFTNVDVFGQTPGTSLTAVQLQSGLQYYFRVRVTEPMNSKWSTPVSFKTMITSDVNQGLNAEGRIFPQNGATITNSKPAITWGSVTGATYDLKLAKDAAFTQIVDEKSGLTATVYSPAAELTPGTYFWQVRAVAGTNVSNWVQSAFTVAPAAAPGGTATQPPPVITVNPPVITVVPPAVTVQPPVVTVVPDGGEAPATPGYIWVIIAIGAVLVIAVIVLIARTRRT